MLLSRNLVPGLRRALYRQPKLAPNVPVPTRNYNVKESTPQLPLLSPINIDDRAIRLAPYNVTPIEFKGYSNVLGIASLYNNGHTGTYYTILYSNSLIYFQDLWNQGRNNFVSHHNVTMIMMMIMIIIIIIIIINNNKLALWLMEP